MKHYDNDHYCEYCVQIFDPENSNEIDDKEWIMCEGCERWVIIIIYLLESRGV